MCFLLLLGLSKGTYEKKSKNSEKKSKNSEKKSKNSEKKSKNSERKKMPHAPPNIHHAHLMYWNLSLTFFPFLQ